MEYAKKVQNGPKESKNKIKINKIINCSNMLLVKKNVENHAVIICLEYSLSIIWNRKSLWKQIYTKSLKSTKKDSDKMHMGCTRA